jgi:prevent-host-death family protein
MTEVVNMHQAKTSLSRLVERALAGEDVLIGRNGQPLVQLVRIEKQREPRIPGRSKGRILMASDFGTMSDAELKDWEGR